MDLIKPRSGSRSWGSAHAPKLQDVIREETENYEVEVSREMSRKFKALFDAQLDRLRELARGDIVDAGDVCQWWVVWSRDHKTFATLTVDGDCYSPNEWQDVAERGGTVAVFEAPVGVSDARTLERKIGNDVWSVGEHEIASKTFRHFEDAIDAVERWQSTGRLSWT